jgi:beta-N-acetylhexosaminidase
MPLAAIFGCAGLSLTEAEKSFYRDCDPVGFILFARNVDTPDQVRRLNDNLRETVQRDDAPILIDQEGGRVARLRAPHWRHPPAAELFGRIHAQDSAAGIQAARLNAGVIGAELLELGLTVDCLPLVDLRFDGAHDIIGDRAFSDDPEVVATLGRAAADGLIDAGVLPVIKHIPGHGRAVVDTHEALPTVDTSLEDLRATDFHPFKALSDMPIAMTAHIVYQSIDPLFPATTSPTLIEDIIRREMGFDGLLLSDDLSMKALQGGFQERARDAVAAGCDIALHCNGDMTEMRDVAAGTPALSDSGVDRLERALSRVSGGGTGDAGDWLAELDDLISKTIA